VFGSASLLYGRRPTAPAKHTSTVGARLPAKMASALNLSLTHRHLITQPVCWRGGRLLLRYLCSARQALADVLIGSGAVT
jgi:hypothetical protein